MSTLKIEEKFTVAAPVERVWEFLLSPERVAGCLPGAALRGQEGADTYLGTMKIKVGPVTSEFKGKATMSDIDPVAHRLKLSGTGDDVSGGGSARMTMDLGVSATAEGSEVQVIADVDIAGKLVRFGRGMIEGVSKQLFKQFVERARERIASAAAAPSSEASPSAAAAEPAPASTPEEVNAPEAKPDAAKAEEAKAPEAKPDAAKAEEARAPEAKAEEAKPAAAKPDAAKAEEAKAPEAKLEAEKAPAAKLEGEKAPEAKPEGEKAPQTKAEPDKAPEREASAGPAASPGRGPAPAPEPSDITTGVLPRPKPRPMEITIPKEEPEALDAGSLVFRALWEWIKSLFRRLLGRGK